MVFVLFVYHHCNSNKKVAKVTKESKVSEITWSVILQSEFSIRITDYKFSCSSQSMFDTVNIN